MYIVAGCLTILWSFLILWLMPPDPIRAKRFTDRERYIAVARMKINNSGVRNTHFKREQLWELLVDVKFWMVFAMAFLILVANGPVSTFTPIIINDLGFSGLNSLLLIMPAGFIIGTIEWTVPYLCYKKKGLRAIMVAVTVCFTLLASLLLWQLPQSSTGAKLFAVYILASFGGGYAVLMSMQIANTAGYTKRSLGSSGMFVGYCLVGILPPRQSAPLTHRTGQLRWSTRFQAVRSTSVSYRLDHYCCHLSCSNCTGDRIPLLLLVGKQEARRAGRRSIRPCV